MFKAKLVFKAGEAQYFGHEHFAAVPSTVTRATFICCTPEFFDDVRCNAISLCRAKKHRCEVLPHDVRSIEFFS